MWKCQELGREYRHRRRIVNLRRVLLIQIDKTRLIEFTSSNPFSLRRGPDHGAADDLHALRADGRTRSAGGVQRADRRAHRDREVLHWARGRPELARKGEPGTPRLPRADSSHLWRGSSGSESSFITSSRNSRGRPPQEESLKARTWAPSSPGPSTLRLPARYPRRCCADR